MNLGRWRHWLVLVAAGPMFAYAQADPLRVEAFSLEPAPLWQRLPAENENENDAFLLEWFAEIDTAFQVLIPRHAPVLKTDAESYYRNLEQKWRAQYGADAEIAWQGAGDEKWLACRRPSRESTANVFHLSRAFEGHAYSLLVFAPREIRVLPQTVHDLVSSAHFGAPQAHWQRTRLYRVQPRGEVLEALLQSDVEHLGKDAMLTGYGLEFGENSASFFVEGFRWRGEGGRRAERVPFGFRSRLEVEAPSLLEDKADWKIRLALEGGEVPITARLILHDLCAQDSEIADALEHLKKVRELPWSD